MRAEVALIDQGAALGPTEIVAKSATLDIAGRVLQVNLETHAVTAGDVWVFDPETRLLFAGDLVTLPAPFFESACPSRWRSALAHLEKQPFDLLVPGHGSAMHKKGFTAYAKAFSSLLACAAGDAPKNVCIDGWINEAPALIDSKDVSYARTLIAYYMDNYLRHPSERVRTLCTAP
jgi:glyoxylase-like metal-dependent hydrolase (beta-lactamase superfamily II)